MLPQCALSLPSLAWSPRVACLVVAAAWHVFATCAPALDVPRVATDAPFVVVDGKITTTSGYCDVLRAPRCSARTSIVVVALGTCSFFDVHVAGARVPPAATAQVEMLVRGAVRPFRWRVVAPVCPVSRTQAVVASESLACERAFRLYIPEAASARGAKSDETDALAVYRLVLCGVEGSVTRIRQGRAWFANGPFSGDVRHARTCVRMPWADVFLDEDVERAFGQVVPCGTGHVLRAPVACDMAVAQYRAPMDFARHELPARCTAQLLLTDGSVVTLTDTTPPQMPVPLVGVVEARFRTTGIVCQHAHRAVTSEEPCALRLVTDRDGHKVLLASAPIVVM
jgi:hypothetical protein